MKWTYDEFNDVYEDLPIGMYYFCKMPYKKNLTIHETKLKTLRVNKVSNNSLVELFDPVGNCWKEVHVGHISNSVDTLIMCFDNQEEAIKYKLRRLRMIEQEIVAELENYKANMVKILNDENYFKMLEKHPEVLI